MPEEESTEVRVRETRRRDGEFIETAAELAGGFARLGWNLLRLPLAILPPEGRAHTTNAVRELSLAFVRLPRDFVDIAGTKIEEWAAEGGAGVQGSRATVADLTQHISVEAESRAAPLDVEAKAKSPAPFVPMAPTGVAIAHLEFDPPGKDIDGEYVLLRNEGGAPADLSGWVLRDTSDHVFTFGSFSLAPGAEVKIWTKAGEPDAQNLYFGSKTPIWNNSGDTATLLDAAGNTVQTFSYEGSKP